MATPLYTVHRITITSAIVMSLLILAYGMWRYYDTEEKWAITMAIGAGAFGLLLALYLRWFLRKKKPQA
jgi:multisubunit Na+/H+ antiporter MnhB subunit